MLTEVRGRQNLIFKNAQQMEDNTLTFFHQAGWDGDYEVSDSRQFSWSVSSL